EESADVDADPGPLRASSRRRSCPDLEELTRHARRGHVPIRSPDLVFIPREPNYVGSAGAPVHSGPWDYLVDVPLVLYGPGHVRAAGDVDAGASMVDLAPTTARLIDFRGLGRTHGHVLDQALIGAPRPPRLVVTIVWDGGGWNVLRAHPNRWPFLARLMRRGASYTRMTVGSSPSVTPPIHATLATGMWPFAHGIPGLRLRTRSNEYVDPMLGLDMSNLEAPTVADLYDRAQSNRPVTGMMAASNWHLAMIGHGASFPGGDDDPAVLVDDEGGTYTNSELFSLPVGPDPALYERLAQELDASDGKRDERWRGHPLEKAAVGYSSPSQVAYQQILLERLVEAGGFGADGVPDLLYANFKPSDDSGHRWGMTSKETGETIAAQDRALRRLVGFLDRTVGGGRWVLMLTADHGQTPYPQESGAWPVGGAELQSDANRGLDRTRNGVELVDRVVSAGAYVRRDELEANGIGLERIGRWLARYTVGENLEESRLPGYYDGKRSDAIFDAVLARGKVAGRSCRTE
ncbi:MAG: alkaline phosphatase family protein, partial [Actinomycetota bacterium]